MGGKRGKGNNAKAGAQPHVSLTLREESSGKKQVHMNAKTMCKLDHLKSLAAWAATEASIPSLGAFFGERLAATTEALGIRSDPSQFVCERCEAILQPGYNCIIRIEKNHPKKRRQKKSNLTTQNTIVYTCNFCSHRNLMRGTPKGYMKEICPPKAKPLQSAAEKQASSKKPAATIPSFIALDTPAVPTADSQNLEASSRQNQEASSPVPSLPTVGISLLDSRRKKRNRSAAKKVVEHEHAQATMDTDTDAGKSMSSNKRRKKSWTSLKEIAQSNEHDASKNRLSNLTIPFFI
ncbi:uncharacterized protein LOC127265464 [Andrographis paniculata]|uniref:uncharacterized protein LOC127265464 n=1 Tax=Andrographis paniculata TaxID=175694 RepID=UPI0021E89D79|nr:uncharacterized protein LOC127265464 [Andrographis paniculata]XP_051151215.1 uncharacterized protein LOC127265464 [Andrographis paniculata]